MRNQRYLPVVMLLGALTSACSGGDEGPTCQFHTQAALSENSSWPKFRHDLANTGTLTGVDLTAGTLQPAWVFSPTNEAPAAFAASPVLNSAQTLIYIGSTNGSLYALNVSDGSLNAIMLSSGTPISSTVLLAVRGGGDALFLGGGNGFIYDLNASGVNEPQFWPFPTNASITGGPSLSNIDGTVYASTPTGFFAICPNGIARFGYTYQGLQSPQAVGSDGTVYFGSNDAQLRAIFPNGRFNWSFSASGPIFAAPVVDTTTNSIFMADTNGRVFKVTSDGTPDPDFRTAHIGPVRASPALAGGTLYVPSTDGRLYAINAALGGEPIWEYPTGAQILSSPAVAVNADGMPVIAFGSDDGNLYIVEDTGTAPSTLQVCQLGTNFACTPEPPPTPSGPQIRSSPAIGPDGTIYVGADDGGVYAVRPSSGAAVTP